ncbi:putative transcriptional regulator, TetR family [Nocardia nova SH22a]|uniref:Putative transcriptional regulator, TetR family n=1 Tax=Nocardia nova SH22a TaxID=1415166 RepID=W5T8K7_9NOCA|nr:TetR/AcrR family transcriptional regulator [Nocardia nova]AHH15454.1 putative transcriptional regulator, TetR family [Nocardia nova SH22a]
MGTVKETVCPIKARLPRIPQQRRSRERVEQILDAAAELLLAEGIEGFSVPRIAQDLDWPRATIYKFFPSVESMLYGLAERHAGQLRSDLAAADCGDLTDLVGAAASSYQIPVFAAVAMSGRAGVEDPATTVLAEAIARLYPAPEAAASLAAATIRACLVHGLRTDGGIDISHLQAAARAAHVCLDTLADPRVAPDDALQATR